MFDEFFPEAPTFSCNNQWRQESNPCPKTKVRNMWFNFSLNPLKFPLTRETDTQKKTEQFFKT